MVDPRESRFWQAAVRSGLIDAAAMNACWEEIPQEKRTADAIDRRLARQAVSSGRMTLWQAQQILAGRFQGLRIDRYVLLDLIGQGGMGRVYLAQDTRLGRKVAVKVLSRERMNNPRAVARFRREAKVGAQLQHENLVRIYDEGEAHGVHYLVMEYIIGKTVGHLIAEEGRLDPAKAASLARQVAHGLEHLHEKGLLHRDINPMNILVDRDGTAKLTDLGLAIDLEDEEDVVTREGATVGTFDYISPEQARHSRQVDVRSDIYSLGCSLYHMIAGRVPFPAPSLPEKLFAHQSKEPEPLTKLVPGVPEGLDAVVRKMMSKRPEDRYQTPSAVARALQPFAAIPVKTITGSIDDMTREAPISPTVPVPESRQSSTEVPTQVVTNGVLQVSKRSGSDVDLPIITTPESKPLAPELNSDPMDFMPKIDFGPEAPLSDSLSSVRSASDEIPSYPRWLVPGGLALLVMVAIVLGGFFLLRGSGSEGAGAPVASDGGKSGGTSTKNTQEYVPLSDITVVYGSGDVTSVSDLHQAIQLAMGKPAAIVLHNTKPMNFEATKPLIISSGELTIRAAPGVRPVLGIAFRGPGTFFQVNPNSSLRLIGLTFQTECDNTPARPATLIDAKGKLELQRCAFSTSSQDRRLRIVSAEGLETRITGCWFEGFDSPIALHAFPGSRTRLEQCMLIRHGAASTVSAWPITITSRPLASKNQNHTLVLDHCTIVGSGLLRAEGFDEKTPLTVKVFDTVASVKSLLMWSENYPEGLNWDGRGNVYDLSTPENWVVVPAEGTKAAPKSPRGLKDWAQGAIHEVESQAIDLTFADASPDEGHTPSDYAVTNVPSPRPGADPSQVGPPGSTTSVARKR